MCGDMLRLSWRCFSIGYGRPLTTVTNTAVSGIYLPSAKPPGIPTTRGHDRRDAIRKQTHIFGGAGGTGAGAGAGGYLRVSSVSKNTYILYLGSQRLREAVGRNAQVALEVLHHRTGERERLSPLDHLLLRQVVLDHELREVSHHLGGGGHLLGARRERETHTEACLQTGGGGDASIQKQKQDLTARANFSRESPKNKYMRRLMTTMWYAPWFLRKALPCVRSRLLYARKERRSGGRKSRSRKRATRERNATTAAKRSTCTAATNQLHNQQQERHVSPNTCPSADKSMSRHGKELLLLYVQVVLLLYATLMMSPRRRLAEA